MSNAQNVEIQYFSDVLCVWAWIAVRRLDELDRDWGNQVEVRHRFINVFGDAHAKIERGWADRNGFDGFAEHVAESAERYLDQPVCGNIWRSVRPTTSTNAHLVLKAAELTNPKLEMPKLGHAIRSAFFVDGQDISQIELLTDVVAQHGADQAAIGEALRSGRAMAALISDYDSALAASLKGSPTWVMNEGRQLLYGNVGYRVLSANVQELLRSTADEASWC